jgi:hypothetical protein
MMALTLVNNEYAVDDKIKEQASKAFALREKLPKLSLSRNLFQRHIAIRASLEYYDRQ